MNFTEAFAHYGAKLANPQWAFSAIAPDGALVISCWQHKFTRPAPGVLRYADRLTRVRENEPGRNLLASHIRVAHAGRLPVRLVIASTKDTATVDRGDDASAVKKEFTAREDLVGTVAEFDGDHYVIEFRQASKA